ncbi:MAG: hypothetical protein KKB51_08135 [Candidatus Riflebacteria bacterium]|nr:hypothetical protein [Candidatus Riflebacteria bacterium]
MINLQRITLYFIVLLVFAFSGSSAVQAFDFEKIKTEINTAVKDNNGELKLADLEVFKFLPAGQVILKNAKLYESPKNSDLLILFGRGSLPSVFGGLAKKDSDMVITVAPDVATSRQNKDLLCTLTGFFDAGGIGNFYEKMENNIFKELLSGKCFFSHSNAKQTLTSDMLPDEVKKKFAAVLGNEFVLVLQDGVTLTSEVNFNPQNAKMKPVKDFAKLMNFDKMGIVPSVFLSPDWKHITLKCMLGDGFKMGFLPDMFSATVPYFFVNLSEFGVGFEISFKTPPNNDLVLGLAQISIPFLMGTSSAPAKQDDALSKAATVAGQAFSVQKVEPVRKDSAVLLAGMTGIWKDAFGIRNLDMYDLVIKGEVPLYVTSLGFGIGGRFDIGNVPVALGGKFPVGFAISKVAVMGKASKIPFGDLVALIIKSSGERKEKSQLPIEKLALKNVIISVAAQDDRDLNIKEGMTFAGTLELNGQEIGMVDVRTTHPEQSGLLKPLVGFKAEGWVKRIKLGPLEITGNGPDDKLNTKDDGVFLDLAYGTKLSDHLKFSGLLKLFSAEKEAQIGITDSSIDIFLRDKIFDLYESEITLRGKLDLKNPEFLAKVALTESFADDAVKFATEFFNDAIEDMTESIEDARENFEDATDNINDARKDAAKGIDGFKKDVEKIAEKVEKAEKKVKRLDKSLDKKQEQLKNLKWNKFKKRAKLVSQIAYLKPALATAKFALKSLKALMSEKNMDKAAEGLKKAADEALKVAENALKEASEKMEEAQALAEKATAFSGKMKDFGKNFKIDEAGFEMSLADMKKNKTPKLYFKAEVFGKKINGDAQFDFTDQKQAFLSLTKSVFEKYAEQEKQLGGAALLLLNSL